MSQQNVILSYTAVGAQNLAVQLNVYCVHQVIYFAVLCAPPVTQSSAYEGWNFNSGNYLFTTDTK